MVKKRKKPASRTSKGGTATRRSSTRLLEGLQLAQGKKLDVDRLLCELAGESESRRTEIFQRFASISDDRSARRDAAMDLIVALKEGNADAALALGHLKAKEGLAELQKIAQRNDSTKIYRNAIKALCMLGREAFTAVDEISKAFLEGDGLEREAAAALAQMDSFGLGMLETVFQEYKVFERKKVLAALEAVGNAGAMAKSSLPALKSMRTEHGFDSELENALEDAIRKITATPS